MSCNLHTNLLYKHLYNRKKYWGFISIYIASDEISVDHQNEYVPVIIAGQVKLVKDSVASTSRKKRNVRKHSFDRSLPSATSTKMARVEEDKTPTPTAALPVSHTTQHVASTIVPLSHATITIKVRL